jgi:hypothetical protein
MVGYRAAVLCITVSDFATEDTRNELLSSGIVEAIVKEITLLNEEWLRYVFSVSCSRITFDKDKLKGPARII